MLHTPSSDTMDKFAALNRTGLLVQRFYNDLSLRMLFKQGVVFKDYKGYFTYENIMNAIGEEEYGEKFYVEDSYQYIEDCIMECVSQAGVLEEQIGGENIWKNRANSLQLVVLDYRIDILMGLLQQDELLSKPQIDEHLEDHMSVGSFADYFVEADESPMRYASSMFQMLDFALKAPVSSEDALAKQEDAFTVTQQLKKA